MRENANEPFVRNAWYIAAWPEELEDGQIVAVLVEDLEPEATLKVFRRRNGTVELHPANSQYKPLR